jgi:Bardet-Biedl syndrome 4 protein
VRYLQQALAVSATFPALLQLGRTALLAGDPATALAVLDQARERFPDDALSWAVLHNTGLALVRLGRIQDAEEAFASALDLHRQPHSYLALGKLASDAHDYPRALSIYREALAFTPEDPSLLTTIGLLQLLLGHPTEAFQSLGNAAVYSPRDPAAALAVAACMQRAGAVAEALVKYRIPAALSPTMPSLWSNLGMAYFSQGHPGAAVSCLKRARALSPFSFAVSYNLGVVYLHAGLYASAFRSLSAATSLIPASSGADAHPESIPALFMLLGTGLARLGDARNSRASYERALKLSEKTFGKPSQLVQLNYCISLLALKAGDAAAVVLTALQADIAERGVCLGPFVSDAGAEMMPAEALGVGSDLFSSKLAAAELAVAEAFGGSSPE